MTREAAIRHIVIVGGGTAGWLTAGLLASEHGSPAGSENPDAIRVTLVESPDVATIGVGEGTWPTMRGTLARIGIDERTFLAACGAAFKQGTRFDGWTSGSDEDRYYHPFTPPAGYGALNLAPYWLAQRDKVSFVDAVCVQGHLCDRGLAPKDAGAPDYAAVANYGYHLDAGRFAELLREHCTERLGVQHVLAHVDAIQAAPDGDIAAIVTREHGELAGDLFIDCTGFASLLLGRHYEVPWIDRQDVLFNDRALAVQVPYMDGAAPVACQTISTAREGGWIWDIGLATRRGVGYVHAGDHVEPERAAETLASYLERTGAPADFRADPRLIRFRAGHRERFWERNCVAIGMAAGFLEPLEASALVLVELSARMISDELPRSRATMATVARRFNTRFRYRWDRIIDFLKLHYVLSRREEPYWVANRDPSTIPRDLQDRLALWRERPPEPADFEQVDEIFSAASYLYVLYGMGFESDCRQNARFARGAERAQQLFLDNIRQANRTVGALPPHRELLTALTAAAAPTARAG